MKTLLLMATLLLSLGAFSAELGESQSASCDQSIHLGRSQASKEIVLEQDLDIEKEEEIKTISK